MSAPVPLCASLMSAGHENITDTAPLITSTAYTWYSLTADTISEPAAPPTGPGGT